MLNVYFAFGVPLFLLLLYFAVTIFRKKTSVPYLGFVNFIIAGFLTAFSFQVLQFALHQAGNSSRLQVEEEIGYPLMVLGLPLIIGAILVIINIYGAYLRIRKTKK